MTIILLRQFVFLSPLVITTMEVADGCLLLVKNMLDKTSQEVLKLTKAWSLARDNF